jgi:hypothetical protein
MPRAEQLRHAKQKQRTMQRRAGLVHIQLVVPEATAQRLALVRESGALVEFLNDALDRHVIRVADYPVLADIAWNLANELISAREAFALYERNWRHVRSERLTPVETQLIERLTHEFGNGVINA